MLAKLGYRVWAPDLRGYGDSDKPARVRDYRLERLLDDVSGLIDASGSKDVTLISHDWGGVIGWRYAALRPRPISRFVVMNLPHPQLLMRELWRFGPQTRRSWYIFFFQLPWIAERALSRDDYRQVKAAFASMAVDRRRFPKEVLDVFARSAARPGAIPGMLAYYRAAVRYQARGVSWPKVETPTLMIWGEEDIALGRETTIGTSELVSDFTLRYVPNASHWVQQEAPERVNAILAAWLTGERVPEAWEIDPVADAPLVDAST
jgi:pimeloyl-ACP methyl ester carboxylesterase